MGHYQIKYFSSDRLLPLIITQLTEMVVLDCQAHVILMDLRILSDEISVNLFLLSVIEHVLYENLEVIRDLSVFVK